MELVEIYQCLCDQTRLRILNLLLRGPLCVCHLQEVLEEKQVKVSKHLAYLKERGLVTAERRGTWMIHAIATDRAPELERNLACLQDCTRENPIFTEDLKRLTQLESTVDAVNACCAPSTCASTPSQT
ncbi:ArsR/SmtB family transcription factor [Actomonas aquatica]|uniref:Metalloregulator ArsR/SmtB family transcription factor n=1 Tax=Actomonas aquatica TaxID=2866162 RepID=A0ABZ1CC38_9BACT|nr:metalloregulator ArsR/SmtB family transcription factor [Opitutus sp. WL0086]WRQ89134.1 metalloregulator ArsR/SmtB family transcription factor [Opitutus sp. WL0086]